MAGKQVALVCRESLSIVWAPPPGSTAAPLVSGSALCLWRSQGLRGGMFAGSRTVT